MPQKPDTVNYGYKKQWITPQFIAVEFTETQSGVPVDAETNNGWFDDSS